MILGPLIQSAGIVAAISFLIDFEKRASEAFGEEDPQRRNLWLVRHAQIACIQLTGDPATSVAMVRLTPFMRFRPMVEFDYGQDGNHPSYI